MKPILTTILLALAYSLPCGAQDNRPIPANTAQQPPASTNSIRFNLDFPGGTPQQLVDAIGRASGRTLNAIITPEHAKLQIPPLKMSNVDVVDLFQALESATTRNFMWGPSGAPQKGNTSVTFKTPARDPDHSSIWYLSVREVRDPFEQAKYCQFYNLEPYLGTYKVEDITTAIQTGWKLLGDENIPILNFHKDTKLLIAVGQPEKVQLIAAVLQQLSQQLANAKSTNTSIGKQITAPKQ